MKQKNVHIGGTQQPLFTPESDWCPPKELPDLRGKVKEIGFDIETRDTFLAVGMGSGWPYKGGFIIGVAVAWDGGSFYAPVKHLDSECMDPQNVAQWIKDHIAAKIRFVGHNIGYDIAWIKTEWGIEAPELIDDTTCQSVMVDENRSSYKLDDICKWLGIPGKDETLLKEAAAAYGFANDIKGNLWKLPARYVGPYAEADAVATLEVAQRLRLIMEQEETVAAYRLEMDLIPLVLEMRRRGVRIDGDAAERARDDLKRRRDSALSDLSHKLGKTVGMKELNSAQYLARFFDAENITYPRTVKTGMPSFENDELEKNSHWLPQSVVLIKQLEMAQSKFLQGFLLNYAHNGRLHASINQFRGEEGGTRSHRFSLSDPPLQQIYGRDSTPLKAELAYVVRGCFLPEEGEFWAAADMSQAEYRLIVHYGELMNKPKAKEAGDRYRTDPHTDYHDMVAEMTRLDRKRAKDTNFAKSYGAGVKKFASMTGMSFEEAQEVMILYDELVPFVKASSQEAQKRAERLGYIKLIDGARCHFEKYEPFYRDWDKEKEYRGSRGLGPCSREEALERINDPEHPWIGQIRRADTNKAFNRACQGSAARQLKKAMLDCWKEGIVPLITMHDELGVSCANESKGLLVARLMRDAVTLTVPNKVDLEWGVTWGTARTIKSEEKQVLYGGTWSEAQRLRSEGRWW